MNIWKSVAALIAGALASVVGGLYFQVWTPPTDTVGVFVMAMSVLAIVLILYVSGTFQKFGIAFVCGGEGERR